MYAAARRTERLHKLTEAGIHPLAMDVTDDASMEAGVQAILTEQGCIDVLVNNAGYGSYGARPRAAKRKRHWHSSSGYAT